MTTPVAVNVGDLFATDVARLHVVASDDRGRIVYAGTATVIALDSANGVLIAKTDDGREVRVPVEVATAPAGDAS